MNNQASILSDADLEQVIGGVDTPVFRNALDNSAARQAKSASIGEMKSLQVETPVFRT
jgi:hypothetical protein